MIAPSSRPYPSLVVTREEDISDSLCKGSKHFPPSRGVRDNFPAMSSSGLRHFRGVATSSVTVSGAVSTS